MECPTCHESNEENAVVCKRCGVILRSGKTPNADSINVSQVKIVDIDMPFLSMVNFMAKAVFAAIPAALVVIIISAMVGGLFVAIFRH